MKKLLLFLSVVAIALLAACGKSPAAPAAAVPASHIKLSIDAKEFSFTPAQVTVKVGQTVEVDMKNTGVTVHDFSIEKIALDGTPIAKSDDEHMSGAMTDHMSGTHADDLIVHVAAEAGQSGMVTFTPTEAGEYEFYCTVAGHKASGMFGKLVVTAP